MGSTFGVEHHLLDTGLTQSNLRIVAGTKLYWYRLALEYLQSDRS